MPKASVLAAAKSAEEARTLPKPYQLHSGKFNQDLWQHLWLPFRCADLEVKPSLVLLESDGSATVLGTRMSADLLWARAYSPEELQLVLTFFFVRRVLQKEAVS